MHVWIHLVPLFRLCESFCHKSFFGIWLQWSETFLEHCAHCDLALQRCRAEEVLRAVKFLHQPADTNFKSLFHIVSQGLTCPTCLGILYHIICILIYNIYLVSPCWRPLPEKHTTKSPKYTVSPAILMHNTDASFWTFGTLVLIFPVSCPTVCLSLFIW